MKYTFETEINAPREKVAELFGNPDNRKKWMEGLESNEHVSGEPGTPGAKSRLVFQTGKVKITFIGTVTARNHGRLKCVNCHKKYICCLVSSKD